MEGHELHEEDIRLIYTFDQATGGTAQFEAHSDAQALVLLDVTPDQSMVDKGMAREVINRIQKLRKKVSRFLQGRAVALGLYWIYLERWGRETRQAV